MHTKIFRPPGFHGGIRSAIAIICSISLASASAASMYQDASSSQAQPQRIPNDKLDAMVAPIALYPDPLLGQVLVSSTYPLEIVQLEQWLEKNKALAGKQLTDAVEKQSWDPSVQAMAAFPDVVKNMTENIKWTADLGNAFLAQQGDVMDAVQRMRAKAEQSGKLESTSQQTVQTQVDQGKNVIVIQPASPDVVYVPTYDPVAVWGAPMYYPYPPVYYPPGYVAAASAISFGVGIAIGAAWGGGGWGWGCGWGGGNIVINNNNAFVNHYNQNRINGGNRYAGNGNRWQHNPAHRGGAPYGDRATAQRFGGNTTAGRQAAARQSANRMQSGLGNARPNGSNGIGNGRPNPGGGVGSANRGGNLGGIGSGNRGANPGSIGSANRSAAGLGGMGGDRIGNRQTSPSVGGRQGAFGGAGMGGQGARQSIQRGRSSMGGGFSRGGGGFSRGGGMRGGGRRR